MDPPPDDEPGRFRAATAHGHLPTSLIAAWRQTVERCEEGYPDYLHGFGVLARIA
ncbi:hypothetical protein [Actinoplanes solisilvae]|uniref:hypothetical protein n=1 Tax=Actinoplanes solisilvae TaxID=2486853 RepID=UPI0013E3F2F2|nr:hypothetical protein [Actinoplanes solisilvae]